MAFQVAINGFGRIGRMTLRVLLQKPGITVSSINDLAEPAALAHLFKYDTSQGKFDGEISSDDNNLIINGNKIRIFNEHDPELLPWSAENIDLLLESTGLCRSRQDAEKHIASGAKKVLVSAPSKGVKTIVLGVNEHDLTEDDLVISNASCTTNCLAPMVKVLDENWVLERAFMTTTHSYTSDQVLQDRQHRDLRRARAAGQNIIPTTTGAAEAIEYVMPHLAGKIIGTAVRVPIINGSLTELFCLLKGDTSILDINAAFKKESERLKGILAYNEDPIVSSDIIGNTHSCIFDAPLTQVLGGNMVKIVGWYDNETGYSNRLADLIAIMSKF